MDVRVDAARRNVSTSGVDDPGGLRIGQGRQVGRDAEDLAILDADALAGREDFGGSDLLTVCEISRVIDQCVGRQVSKDSQLWRF